MTIQTFIARSKQSFDDFIESGFAQQRCCIHCQFSRQQLNELDLCRLERTNVVTLSFSIDGEMFKRGQAWAKKH